MKKVIRFELEGLTNSFKIPFYKNYDKTFLSPPKTTIIGMLCNISLKNFYEFYDILNKDIIKISVVINKIEGKFQDLWSYKTLKNDNTHGKSIIRRETLYKPYYTIYLTIKDKELFKIFKKNLQNPQSIPTLGQNDELVIIKNVKIIDLEINNTLKINSVFLDKNYIFKIKSNDINKMILTSKEEVPTKFKILKNNLREPLEKFNQVEYINCEVEFKEKYIESFVDIEYNNKIVFY